MYNKFSSECNGNPLVTPRLLCWTLSKMKEYKSKSVCFTSRI